MKSAKCASTKESFSNNVPANSEIVCHIASRTLAIGCVANGHNRGATLVTLNMSLVSFLSQSFASKLMIGLALGDKSSNSNNAFHSVSKNISNKLPPSSSSFFTSTAPAPSSSFFKICGFNDSLAGKAASAAAARTSSSSSFKATINLGSAEGSNFCTNMSIFTRSPCGIDAKTYFKPIKPECLTSHAFSYFNKVNVASPISKTFRVGKSRKDAPKACAAVSRTGATTPSPTKSPNLSSARTHKRRTDISSSHEKFARICASAVPGCTFTKVLLGDFASSPPVVVSKVSIKMFAHSAWYLKISLKATAAPCLSSHRLLNNENAKNSHVLVNGHDPASISCDSSSSSSCLCFSSISSCFLCCSFTSTLLPPFVCFFFFFFPVSPASSFSSSSLSSSSI